MTEAAITTINVADLVKGVKTYADSYLGVDSVVHTLIEAGASTELRRIAAAVGGFGNSPDSWKVDLDVDHVDRLNGGTRIVRCDLHARWHAIWTSRWAEVEVKNLNLRLTTGGNLVVRGDEAFDDEGKQVVDDDLTYLVIDTGKDAERHYQYVVEFASDTQEVFGDDDPEQPLAEAIVYRLLEAHARQEEVAWLRSL